MVYFTHILFNGLHTGMIYAVLAYGYVLIYLVTKRPNLAHGAVFAFAGQVLVQATTYAFQSLFLSLGVALVFGVTTSFLVCGGVVVGLAREVYVPLSSRSPNMMIAATLGVSIVLMEVARLGVNTRDLWLPPLLTTRIAVLPFADAPALTLLQLLNIAIMLAVIGAAHWILTRTQGGRAVRAVADDPLALALCGTAPLRVTYGALFLGGFLSITAGILAVLYYGNMSFGAGLIYGLKVLFIAAAGGFANPLAAAVSALGFGMAEQFWDGYLPLAWRDVALTSALAFLLVIQGRKGDG